MRANCGILIVQQICCEVPCDAAARVLRGGSWNNNQDNARAAYRNNNNPNNRNNNNGFRLVRPTCASRFKGLICALLAGQRAAPFDQGQLPPVMQCDGCSALWRVQQCVSLPRRSNGEGAGASRPHGVQAAPSGLYKTHSGPRARLWRQLAFIQPPSKRPISATIALTCRYCPSLIHSQW